MPVGSVVQPTILTEYKDLILETKINDGVAMSSAATDRILGLITAKLEAKKPPRFETINTAVAGDRLHVLVKFTRYDEGHATARFMLPGLGQIHIDADVILKDYAKDKLLGQYKVDKTFAWGGVVGASTDIKEVEEGFAESVVALILGDPKGSDAITTLIILIFLASMMLLAKIRLTRVTVELSGCGVNLTISHLSPQVKCDTVCRGRLSDPAFRVPATRPFSEGNCWIAVKPERGKRDDCLFLQEDADATLTRINHRA